MLDLHVHSNISDGQLSPEDLLKYASENKIKILAIADHETIINYDIYIQYASLYDIELIPAIEMNVCDYRNFHILGYYIKNRQKMEKHIINIRKENSEICYNVIKSLKKEYGIHLDVLKVVSYNVDGILDKKAIAKAMIDLGYANKTKDIYDNYIGPNAKSYIPIKKIDAQTAIRLIHSCGGIAIWAHPYTIANPEGKLFNQTEFDIVCKKLINYGIDGVEVYSTKHTMLQIEKLETLALKNKLLITGGSDFHSQTNDVIGCPQLTKHHLEKLQEASLHFDWYDKLTTLNKERF